MAKKRNVSKEKLVSIAKDLDNGLILARELDKTNGEQSKILCNLISDINYLFGVIGYDYVTNKFKKNVKIKVKD